MSNRKETLGRYQEHWLRVPLRWGELHTSATSVLEIFHMPGLYRKASSVNRKVCFQKRETNLDIPGGGLNGLPNRPEFSCVNTGQRGWKGWGRGASHQSPPSGIKSETELNRMRKSLNINKSSLGVLLLHTPCCLLPVITAGKVRLSPDTRSSGGIMPLHQPGKYQAEAVDLYLMHWCILLTLNK